MSGEAPTAADVRLLRVDHGDPVRLPFGDGNNLFLAAAHPDLFG